MHVVLLHDDIPPDARPDELDVFVQAELIEAALRELGHSASRLPFTLDLGGVRAGLSRGADLVFNLVESVAGHSRLLYLAPALLDALGVRYTGAPTEALFLTTNKLLAKELLRAHGLPTPAWFCAAGHVPAERFGRGTYVIKLVWEEASVGLDDDAVVTAASGDELREAILARSRRLGGEAFAEAYVDGREFNLSVLGGPEGPQVLPPAEIHFVDYAPGRPKLVGYRAKWDTTSFEYHHTPRCFDFPPQDAPLLNELGRLARACWHLFGLRGYARVDFRVDAAGQPWILEINANPCLAPDAGFMAAAAQAGLDAAAVVARILGDSHARTTDVE